MQGALNGKRRDTALIEVDNTYGVPGALVSASRRLNQGREWLGELARGLATALPQGGTALRTMVILIGCAILVNVITVPFMSFLTRSLGTSPEVQIDLDEHPLFPGDVLLLCSDGLGKELSDDKILQVVNETPDPAELAKRLIQLANTAGGRDNITVAAARLDKAGLGQSIKGFFKSITG